LDQTEGLVGPSTEHEGNEARGKKKTRREPGWTKAKFATFRRKEVYLETGVIVSGGDG